MHYLCGIEVSDLSRSSPEWSCIKIPQQEYAVFKHEDHIFSIGRVWYTIFNRWLPQSEQQLERGPQLERYDKNFDSRNQ
jgi:AraC family transcriptional regulator